MSSNYTYKNDEVELIELGQFIRDVFPNVIVQVESYILYSKTTRKYMGYTKTIPVNCPYGFRNPDIMIINKKTKELITCLELDGGIHTKTIFSDTMERNDLYEELKVPLKVITKAEITTSVFDKVYQKLSKILKDSWLVENLIHLQNLCLMYGMILNEYVQFNPKNPDMLGYLPHEIKCIILEIKHGIFNLEE